MHGKLDIGRLDSFKLDGPADGDPRTWLWRPGSEVITWVKGYIASHPDMDKNDAFLYIYAYDDEDTEEGTWVTDSPVDLTQFSILKIAWASKRTGTGGTVNAVLAVSTNKTGSYSVYDAAISKVSTSPSSPLFPYGQVDTLNISALSGSYYIRVHARENTVSSNTTTSMTVRVGAIWLE